MSVYTNFENPKSLLTDHPDIVDVFTSPYTLVDYLPPDTHDKFQDDKNDRLIARRYFTNYLEQCLRNGHQESVWGALTEIATYDPFASLYIALNILGMSHDQSNRNDITTFIYYLIDTHEILQDNEEITRALKKANPNKNVKSEEQEDYDNEPYSEIGETAIYKATNEQDYIGALFLVNKIIDDEVCTVYLNRLSTIFGQTAVEYANLGDMVKAQNIVDLIPIKSIRQHYGQIIKE